MKKNITLNTLLALSLTCPLYGWAQTGQNPDDQKTAIQNQYKQQRDSENQNYKNQVADASSKYKGDQLTAVKKELELEHTKKLSDLSNDEKINMQKVDAQQHGVQ